MVYDKPLPPVRDLLEFSKDAHFPITRAGLVKAARGEKESETFISFLELFDAGEIFSSKVDFMTKCEELEMLITQERETPPELNHSP